MPLDTLVARVVHQARVLERATNEVGPWTMTLGTPGQSTYRVAPARRDLFEDRIVFTAEFPDCDEQATTVTLDLDGRMESVRPAEFVTTNGPFAITWVIEAAKVPSLA